jgi:hypothetical protein
MIKKRYTKHVFKTSISKHPKFITKRLESLSDKQFGFNAFGLKDNTIFDYYQIPKELKKKFF